MEVKGKFDAERFYKTLAAILSAKHGAKVTVEILGVQESKKVAFQNT
ncbi:hypothetical protein [Hespellia stercorisuis]|uniref:Uncharacterized protein n=1 Tax=Hespellia stercorisuis DSM 15480 TaxID=1121950 RepID=A0A1M6MUI0_9FIRM|nr:hypothetical protein [Hespellia stercorisuis]SHJ87060.1 hypothetical protein SAMN02745243_01598 [Hespellia stercorisuis DSM 15480]